MQTKEFQDRLQYEIRKITYIIKVAFYKGTTEYFTIDYDLASIHHLVRSAYDNVEDKTPENAEKLEDLLHSVLIKYATGFPYVEQAYIMNNKLYIKIHKKQKSLLGRLKKAYDDRNISYNEFDGQLTVTDEDHNELFVINENGDKKYVTIEISQQYGNTGYEDFPGTMVSDLDDADYLIKAINVTKQFMEH